jgi:hypothetical protein
MAVSFFAFQLLAAGGKDDSPAANLWPLHAPEAIADLSIAD